MKGKYSTFMNHTSKTGFDPMAQPKATAPPPAQEAKQGGVVRGAARDALVGVAVGAIAGDAGKGAAIGAAGSVYRAPSGSDRNRCDPGGLSRCQAAFGVGGNCVDRGVEREVMRGFSLTAFNDLRSSGVLEWWSNGRILFFHRSQKTDPCRKSESLKLFFLNQHSNTPVLHYSG